MNQITGNEAFTNEVMRKHQKKYKDMKEFLRAVK